MTEEEKKQKLAELREKMTEKRAKKAEEEAKEHKVNESIRRKAGKVSSLVSSPVFIHKLSPKDMNQIKEDLKLKQALQEAEQKKRGASSVGQS